MTNQDLKLITKNELDKLRNLDVLILNSLRHNEHYSHINLDQEFFLKSIKSRPEQKILQLDL